MERDSKVGEKYKFFWQPGCTSCMRTKEFLKKHGIDYISVDVHNDPTGVDQLRELGIRTIPALSLGKKYTLCQSFGDVTKFLGINVNSKLLPPDELVSKLTVVIETAVRLCAQFTEAQLQETFRDRRRTARDTVFHALRVAEVGVQAAQQMELTAESLLEVAPSGWGSTELARFGAEVTKKLHQWWESEVDRELTYTAPTYYGRRSMHDVLERTTYHSAQHTRQVALMLETYGTQPDRPLTADTLKGLPVPEEVWS